MSEPILLAKNDSADVVLLPKMSNRHGAITGATGTGKTVSLQALAHQFAQRGIPVFMADIKGDLTGISQAGGGNAKVDARLKSLKLDAPSWQGVPVTLWDVFGQQGHPVRATVSDMGPLLLARMLELNETQAGVLQIVFKIADDNGWLLLDMKDLRAMCQYVGDNAKTVTTQYGNVSTASVGAIQRGLLVLEEQGADQFFGEPMLNVADMMQTVGKQGVVNILAADKLFNSPRLYATFLLWMLSELWESLPEVGDLDQPKFVFFFDEAHLLFNEAPKPLLERIEQTVRLIRSKGVGVYFVTQNPLDIPDSVLAQLGNRVQHALRAFTPRDQKAVQVAAQTMRENKGLDIEKAITELEVGEALISVLDEKGTPTPTQRAFVIPPASRIGPIDANERKALLKDSLVAGTYDQAQDRESAYEMLKTHADTKLTQAQAVKQDGGGAGGMVKDALLGSTGPRGGKREGLLEAAAKSAVRSVGSSIGRQIVRGILGGMLGGRR
jgi:uncharacterized protein